MGRRSSRRSFLARSLVAAASASIVLGRGTRAASDREIVISSRALDLVRESAVIDMLGLLTIDWPKLYSWYRDPLRFTEPEFRLLESSGVSIFHPAVYTTRGDPHEDALRWTLAWRRLARDRPCFLSLVTGADDLVRVPERGTLGILIGFQNAEHLREPSDVALFHEAGLRVTQLTYNAANHLGSGCLSRSDGGLTALGASMVEAMNTAGMVIDVSHCGDRTTLDAVRTSRRPLLVTHTNCRTLNPGQRRCKPDEVLRAVAEGGGVIGLTAVRSFVSSASRATLADYLDHFDYLMRLVGPEHVGIGSDLDVEGLDPRTGRVSRSYSIEGLAPRWRVFQLAEGLLARGWTPDDVRLVLGGSFQRALGEILGAAPSQTPDGRRDPFCTAPRRPLLRPEG